MTGPQKHLQPECKKKYSPLIIAEAAQISFMIHLYFMIQLLDTLGKWVWSYLLLLKGLDLFIPEFFTHKTQNSYTK